MVTRITKFDKPTCRQVNQEAREVLNEHFSDRGIRFTEDKSRIADTFMLMTLNVGIVDGDGSVDSLEARDFRDMASTFGLKADDLGRSFQCPGSGRFTIIGYRSRARKRPILTTGEDGKKYRFITEQVVAALAKEEN